jgi:hypothetical protein
MWCIFWPKGICPPAARRDSQSSVNSKHLPPVHTLRDPIDPIAVLLGIRAFHYVFLCIIIIIIIIIGSSSSSSSMYYGNYVILYSTYI